MVERRYERRQLDMPSKDLDNAADRMLHETTSYPECHGATSVEMKNGEIVTSYFGGTKERNPDCCIWVSRKPKGAKEWTEPYLAADGVFDLNNPEISKAGLSGINEETTLAAAGPVATSFEGDITNARRKACWNPVLFQIPDGDFLLFFKIGTVVAAWTGWVTRSTDGGKSWRKNDHLPTGFLGPVKHQP